jgi:hypothetical protein
MLDRLRQVHPLAEGVGEELIEALRRCVWRATLAAILRERTEAEKLNRKRPRSRIAKEAES